MHGVNRALLVSRCTNTAAPYNDKLPAGCGYKYMKCNATGHGRNQLTINPKEYCLLANCWL